MTTTPDNREAVHAKYIFLKGLTKSGRDHEGRSNKLYATTRGKNPTKIKSNIPGSKKVEKGVFLIISSGIFIKCPSGARISNPPPGAAPNPKRSWRITNIHKDKDR